MELAQIRTRVTPLTMAAERTLPIADELAGLFPEGALVRGRVLSCTGPGSTSIALAMAASAMAAGSWLALVDTPDIGLDAASELGVPLQRVVRVSSHDWPSTMAAAMDGFDLILTTVPPLRRAAATMLSSRIRQRGAVVIAIGEPGDLGCDGIIETSQPMWEGLGMGHGRLCRRRLKVRSHGRRIQNERHHTLALPAASGRPEMIREGSDLDSDLGWGPGETIRDEGARTGPGLVRAG